MVNREIIEKWAAALESGDYKQTIGTLQRVEPTEDDSRVGFCCLGVLCHLAVKEGVIEEPFVTRGKAWYGDTIAPQCSELPVVVQVWAGLPNPNPDVTHVYTDEDREQDLVPDELVTGEESLAELNDTYGRDFTEIAQVIRDNFLTKES